MPDIASLQVVVSADTSAAEQGLTSFGQKVSGVGSAITGALGTAAIGAIAGVGAAFVGSVKSAADFEKQISAISAVSGASASELEGLRATALQLGKDTSFSASEAATGMEELVKAGVDLKDVMGGAGRAALDLAAAGAISVADAAEISSNAMNVFNLKGADMAHVADVIAGAANASAISVTDYKFSLASAGAVAATVGIGFEDLSTAIAVMGQAGIKGSDAGTSLKTMMLNLQPSTNKQIDLFRELGLTTTDTESGYQNLVARGIQPAGKSYQELSQAIKTHLGLSADISKWSKDDVKAFNDLEMGTGLLSNAFFDAGGTAKSMAGIAQVLQDKLGGMTKQQQLATLEVMFGSDAIRAGAVLLDAGAAGFTEMAAAMGKVSAQAVANERLNNLWGSIEKLKGSLETGAIMLGSLFTPALKDMADTLTTEVNAGIEILEQIPDVLATIQQVLAGDWSPDASIHPFTLAVGELAVSFRDTLLPTITVVAAFVTETLMPAFQSLAGFLMRHPEIIAAIVAAWGAFVVITTVIGWITGAIAAFGALSGAITAAGGVIAAIVAVLGGPLTIAILAVAAVIGVLTAAWIGNWGDIQGKTAAAVAVIQPLIQTMLTAIQQFWTEHGAAILTILTAAWTMITSQITTALTVITGLITAALQLISGDWSGAWTTITTVATAIWDSWAVQLGAALTILTALFGPAMTTIQGIWDAGWKAITALVTAAWNLLSTENQTRITALTTLMTELWKAIPELWRVGTQAIATLMTEWWATISTTVTTETAKILAFFQKWWTDITALFKTTLDTLRGWWTTFWSTDLGTAITGALAALQESARNLGNAVGDALIAGVNAKVQEMVDAVTGMVSGALSAARSLIGGAGGGSGGNQAWSQIAREEGVDPALLQSLIEQESGGKQSARSGAGAIGLTQLMPGTAAGLGVDPYDELQNVRGGARYLRQMIDQFGSVERGLAAYNAGPGGGVPGESAAYARRVVAGAGKFRVPSEVGAAQRGMIPQIGQQTLAGGTLSGAEAAAFCGPAAAMWFANIYGRMPTKTEAEEMARQVGWTPEWGMTGPGSEQRLLQAMGVSSNVDFSPTPGEVGALASQNVPFMLSTAGHFFQVQGGDLGGLNVGASGTALAGGSAVMSLDRIIALTGAMNGIITLAPQMGNALAASSAVGGTALQGLLVSATTLSDGSTVAITQMGEQITASIVNSSGQVVSTYGAMTTAVATDTATMATTALTSVTNLGTGIMTTITDTAGSTVTTVTTMSGQVTSQYATLANGVSLTMGDMATGVLTSTTDLGTGVMTTVQDMSGNYITTITDMSGNVTAQYTSLAADATAATVTMSEGVTAEVATMSETVLTSVTDLGDGTLTITQDMAGNYIATITDMAGEVTSTYTSMGSDVVGANQDMVDTVVQVISDASSDIGDAVAEWGDAINDGMSDIADEAADMAQEVGQSITDGIADGISDGSGDVSDAVRDVVKDAIDDAKDEAESDSPSKLFARELGLPIAQGVAAGIAAGAGEVYDATRDLVAVPDVPSYAGAGGGGGGDQTITIQLDLGGRVAEEIYVTGRALAVRRGRVPVGFA